MTMESAVRFEETPERCSIHGLRYASFDLLAGKWRCLGEGPHFKRADPGAIPELMRKDMIRMGITPEEVRDDESEEN
jgi:hypothetical protein